MALCAFAAFGATGENQYGEQINSTSTVTLLSVLSFFHAVQALAKKKLITFRRILVSIYYPVGRMTACSEWNDFLGQEPGDTSECTNPGILS